MASTDLGRVARQADDGTLWALSSTAPKTWLQIAQDPALMSVKATGATTASTHADRFAWFYNADDHGVHPDGTPGLAGDYDIYAPLQALIAKVNAAGGGKIVFRRGTYSCRTRRSAANGATRFTFTTLANGLVIEGNGAKIDMNGAYTRAASTDNTMSFEFRDINGLVIRDLEVDGNNQDTTFGSSVQTPDHGIQVIGCTDVELTRVWSHHHPMDGFVVRDGGTTPHVVTISKRVQMTGCVADYNGRQGMSLTGVRHMTVVGSTFSNTGKSSYGVHAPGGGVDIEPDAYPGLWEASGSSNSADDYTGDIHFIGCRFQNNRSEVAISPAWNSTYGIPAGAYYPITFSGCDFTGEVGADPRLGISGRDVRFIHCRFKDVQFFPNYSWGESNNDHTWVDACEFDNSDPDQQVIGWSRNGSGSLASDPPSLSIRNSKFKLNAPSVATPNPTRIYLNALSTTLTKGEFIGNKVWVAGTEHDGTTDDNLAQLDGFVARDNEWITTLDITGGKFWAISYGTSATQVFNERFLTASAFSPTGAVFADSTFSRNTLVTGMLEVGDGVWTGSAKRKIMYRTAVPAAAGVQYLKGDLVIQSNPASAATSWGWICTTAGVAGAAVWTALCPIGMVQAAARADAPTYSGVPGALANAATQVDLNALGTIVNDLLAKLRTAKLLG